VNRLLLIVLAPLLLWGCAATGPAFKPAAAPKDDQVLLYVYWPETSAFGMRTATIGLDGTPIAELGYKGYTVLYTAPGPHRITQLFKPWPGDATEVKRELSISLNTQPGRIYFVEFRTSTAPAPGGTRIQWALGAVSEAKGTQGIAECRYQPPLAK